MAAAAARAGIAGGPLVAVSAPLHMDEIEAEDDCVVDLFVAEIPSRAAALPKLKMRVDGLSEVFHQWELPEDQPEEESSLVDKLQRGAWRGRRIDQDLLSPVGFPSYYRGPPSFDIDEECAFILSLCLFFTYMGSKLINHALHFQRPFSLGVTQLPRRLS